MVRASFLHVCFTKVFDTAIVKPLLDGFRRDKRFEGTYRDQVIKLNFT